MYVHSNNKEFPCDRRGFPRWACLREDVSGGRGDRFEVLPALEGLGVLRLKVGEAFLGGDDAVRIAVERRVGQLAVQCVQLAFQRLDQRRQRLQFLGFLE